MSKTDTTVTRWDRVRLISKPDKVHEIRTRIRPVYTSQKAETYCGILRHSRQFILCDKFEEITCGKCQRMIEAEIRRAIRR